MMAKLPAPRGVSPRRQLAIVAAGALLGSAAVVHSFPFQPILNFIVNSSQIPSIAALSSLCVLGGSMLYLTIRRMEL